MIDWRSLPTPADRNAWLLACLSHQPVRSPWTKILSNQEGLQPPDLAPVHVRLSREQAPSEEWVYCFLGDAVLGYGGYLGQDLDGLHEIVRQLTFDGVPIEVEIDRAALDSCSASWRADGSWAHTFVETLIDAGAVVTETPAGSRTSCAGQGPPDTGLGSRICE